MKREFSILFCASEAAPFAKTGGLADVCGALPMMLSRQGHDVRLVLPYYRSTRFSGVPTIRMDQSVQIAMSGKMLTCPVLRSTMDGVTVYLIEQNAYFDREQLYGVGADDYPDNLERFTCFSKAALALCRRLGWYPDIVHCHDWQASLVAAYVDQVRLREPSLLPHTSTVLTIHNIGYQGLFPKSQFPITDLGAETFVPERVEFYGQANLLKAGIVYADGLTTVSPTYAREIQTPEFGCGLDGVLRDRRDRLIGILNGADYGVWSPELDAFIPQRYSAGDLAGKAVCKAKLQESSGLAKRAETPLIGIVSRLADQKGFDLLAKVLDELMQMELQLVILGAGDKSYETMFGDVAHRFPGKLAVHVKFDNALAHLIEAGSDMFLMPSRYEPCGLNQLYSLKYGTVPVVRRTGGLADTVVDWTPATAAAGAATGVVFESYTPEALVGAVRRALELYASRQAWRRLMLNGMHQDFSWNRSAGEYARLYAALHDRRAKT